MNTTGSTQAIPLIPPGATDDQQMPTNVIATARKARAGLFFEERLAGTQASVARFEYRDDPWFEFVADGTLSTSGMAHDDQR